MKRLVNAVKNKISAGAGDTRKKAKASPRNKSLSQLSEAEVAVVVGADGKNVGDANPPTR